MKVIGYSAYEKESNGVKYLSYYVNCTYEIPKEKGAGLGVKQYCIPSDTLTRQKLKITDIYMKDCEFYYNETFGKSTFKTVGSIVVNG